MHQTTEQQAERRASRQTGMYVTMYEEVISAIRNGVDQKMPPISDEYPIDSGRTVSELLSSCDATQEQLLFKLLHLVLNKDNLQSIHEAGQDLARYVAHDYAEFYVAGHV